MEQKPASVPAPQSTSVARLSVMLVVTEEKLAPPTSPDLYEVETSWALLPGCQS